MPELPDIELYVTRLRERILGATLVRIRFHSPFVLRSVGVSPEDLAGRKIVGVSRLGKRIVLEVEGERFVIVHLMIAGRLQWQSPAPPEKKALGKVLLAAMTFTTGQLSLIETSTRKRAGIWLVSGHDSLEPHRRQGLDVLSATFEEFAARVRRENRTLKRMLTSPHLFDGIGNAYSDEILFLARLSPLKTSGQLSEKEIRQLYLASRQSLESWSERLSTMYPGWPKPQEITAFRPEFNVHGRFGKTCNVCGAPIQRIVYAENETNYCARCQNEGRLLADRSLSRLLKDDWPKTLEEMSGEQ